MPYSCKHCGKKYATKFNHRVHEKKCVQQTSHVTLKTDKRSKRNDSKIEPKRLKEKNSKDFKFKSSKRPKTEKSENASNEEEEKSELIYERFLKSLKTKDGKLNSPTPTQYLPTPTKDLPTPTQYLPANPEYSPTPINPYSPTHPEYSPTYAEYSPTTLENLPMYPTPILDKKPLNDSKIEAKRKKNRRQGNAFWVLYLPLSKPICIEVFFAKTNFEIINFVKWQIKIDFFKSERCSRF